MRRVLQAVTLLVCLAVAAGAPRGLLLAAVAASLGIARSLYAQQSAEPPRRSQRHELPAARRRVPLDP